MTTKLISIVHDLRRAKGTNEKIKILEQHKENQLWKDFLFITYDERISYHVSAPKTSDFDIECIDYEMFAQLHKLSEREVTGNAAKKLAIELSEHYGEIPRLVLDHSVKAGISFKTINKVYSDLIPVFESMKGKDVPFTVFPVESSIKFDGVKVFVKVTEDDITLMTSSGAEFILTSLLKEFEGSMLGVYEGELTHQNGKQVDRPIISGKLNSLLAGTKTDITDYFYRIYDWVPLTEWDLKISLLSFELRQGLLNEQFKMGFQDSAYVKQVEHSTINSIDEALKFYEYYSNDGYEGSMSRYSSDVYIWERTERLIKKKAIKECTLICTGTTPHSNPAKGNVGSLICEGILADKELGVIDIKVSVGSGLSKFDIQHSEERYLNEQIEIIYNTVTITDSGYSLFLPRFKRVVK